MRDGVRLQIGPVVVMLQHRPRHSSARPTTCVVTGVMETTRQLRHQSFGVPLPVPSPCWFDVTACCSSNRCAVLSPIVPLSMEYFGGLRGPGSYWCATFPRFVPRWLVVSYDSRSAGT